MILLNNKIEQKYNNFYIYSLRNMNSSFEKQSKKRHPNQFINYLMEEESKSPKSYNHQSFKKNKIKEFIPEDTDFIKNNRKLSEQLYESSVLRQDLIYESSSSFDKKKNINPNNAPSGCTDWWKNTVESKYIGEMDTRMINNFCNNKGTPLDFRGTNYFNNDSNFDEDISFIYPNKKGLTTTVNNILTKTNEISKQNKKLFVEVENTYNKVLENREKMEEIAKQLEAMQNTSIFASWEFWITSFVVVGGICMYLFNRKAAAAALEAKINISPIGKSTSIIEITLDDPTQSDSRTTTVSPIKDGTFDKNSKIGYFFSGTAFGAVMVFGGSALKNLFKKK